jgi:hypothetical protein
LEVTGGNGGVDRWSWVRIFDFLGVNGGVVHGRGFVGSNLLTFGGQSLVVCMVMGSNLCLFGVNPWCSAWSCVRIFVFLGVNGGVVHGRGFESLNFWMSVQAFTFEKSWRAKNHSPRESCSHS